MSTNPPGPKVERFQELITEFLSGKPLYSQYGTVKIQLIRGTLFEEWGRENPKERYTIGKNMFDVLFFYGLWTLEDPLENKPDA